MERGGPEFGILLDLPADERLDRLRSTDRPEAVMSSLIDAAEAMLLTDLARGLEVTESAVALADGIDAPPVIRSMARRIRAQALAYANRFEDALAILDEGIELADTHGASVEAAQARMTSLHALARLGRLGEAQSIGESARDAFLAAGEKILAAKAELNIGAVLRMNDDPAGAVLRFDRARPLIHDDAMLLAQLESNRGEALLDLNRFAEAEGAFIGAMSSFEQVGIHRAAAIVAGNLGDLTGRQGRLEEALRHFERARRHLEAEAASAEIARVVAESAEVLAALGLPSDALSEYAVALPALREHGLALETARALTGYGGILLELGRDGEADTALAEAADRFRSLGIESGFARVRILQAKLHVRADRIDEALACLHEALAGLADRPADAAVVRGRLAALVLKTDPAAAAAHLAEAIAAAEVLDLRPVIADLLLIRARTRTDDTERLDDLRAAVSHVEQLLGGLPTGTLRTAFLGNRMEAYEDLVAALAGGPASRDRIAEAFAVAESAKSRVLLDRILGSFDFATPATGVSADADQLREVSRLRGELTALYGRMLDVDSSCSGELRSIREAVREREQQLATLDRRLASSRGGRGLLTPPARLTDIDPLLDADTALVEYFFAGDRVLAFVARPGDAKLFVAPVDATAVHRLVRAVHFQMSRAAVWRQADGQVADRLTKDVRRACGNLYDAIVAPIAAAIREVRRLIVVPHGPLHAIPFAALHDGHRYLLDSFEITCIPTAGLLRPLRARRSREDGEGRCLVVSVPDESAPEIGHEVEAVANVLTGVTRLEGAEATADAVRVAIANKDVVHLACHGRFAASTPMASGIRLADRWMSVRELQDLPVDGALVTLSACETGLSSSGRAEDMVGLVRAFLAAGASSVVCSMWPVDDESTRTLMATAYSTWQNEGDGRRGFAGALHNAQRELREERPHPLFWAPFVVIGGE